MYVCIFAYERHYVTLLSMKLTSGLSISIHDVIYNCTSCDIEYVREGYIDRTPFLPTI